MSQYPEQLATQGQLGKFKQIYQPARVYLIALIAFTIISLAFFLLLIFLSIFYSVPGWDFLLSIALGLLTLGIAIASTLKGYHERIRRILLYEQGLIDVAPSRTQVVRWDQVRYVWHTVAIQYAGPPGYVIYTPYTLQTINGVSLSFGMTLARRDELIKNLNQSIIPFLLSQARERYQAGQEVDFDHLVLSKVGLRTKDGSKTLPRSEVASIKVTDRLQIKQHGKKRNWFDRGIPNLKVCETLLDEILAEQSAQGPLEG